jgi:hypothetical protein
MGGPLDNLGDLSSFGPLGGGLPAYSSPIPSSYPSTGPAAPAGFPGIPTAAVKRRPRKPINTKLLVGIATSVLVCLAIVGIGTAAYVWWPAGWRFGIGYSSPQAAFEALKQAQVSRNWGAMYDTVTPDSRERLVSGFAFIAQMAAGQEPEVAAILKKYGVATDAPQPSSPGDFAQFMQNMQDSMKKAAEGVSDKRGFFVELLRYFETREEVKQKLNEDELSKLASAELIDLTIDGDTARAKQTTAIGSGSVTQSIEFRRINGGWLVHLPEHGFLLR